MSHVIFTTYHGPTTTLGARVKATYGNKRGGKKTVTVHWDHGKSPTENHDYAATKLAMEMKWFGTFYRGDLADGGTCYVRVTGEHDRAFAIAL